MGMEYNRMVYHVLHHRNNHVYIVHNDDLQCYARIAKNHNIDYYFTTVSPISNNQTIKYTKKKSF